MNEVQELQKQIKNELLSYYNLSIHEKRDFIAWIIIPVLGYANFSQCEDKEKLQLLIEKIKEKGKDFLPCHVEEWRNLL